MKFKSVKMQLTLNLLGLLALSMLITYLVIDLFWVGGVITNEKKETIHVLEEVVNQEMAVESDSKVELMEIVTKRLKDSYDKHLIYYNGLFYQNNNNDRDAAIIRKIMAIPIVNRNGIIWPVAGWFSVLRGKESEFYVVAPFQDDTSQSVNRKKRIVVKVNLGTQFQAFRVRQKNILAYLVINILCLSTIGFFRLNKLFLNPLERMINISESYQVSGLLPFTSDHSNNEFKKLSVSINNMVARIEEDRKKLLEMIVSLEQANNELVATQREMIQTEKMASVGKLSAGLAHEIGNPIGIVQGYVGLLGQEDLEEAERADFMKRSLDELDRINRLISNLLSFTRVVEHEICNVDVGSIIGEVLEVVHVSKGAKSVQVGHDVEPGLMVKGNSDGLRQVLLNCILNSIDAINDKNGADTGVIYIAAKRVDNEDLKKSFVIVSIEDNGVGMIDDTKNKAFDPFYTTKDVGDGTGLGLYVSHSIIEAHKGKIWFDSEPLKGTTVFIQLPMA
ncbi:sensor histidine kinase [Desulfopila sp. IMCC35008]|uniref:sensor histidine kinase n=1 Tax=Desulfopila sp. IMCC35008 TaxID=2653858 RepID=UPI0013D78BB6|nr:HAMP domain-containing sensor histidine kinase [Desulfopila sp. IMCC35008]